MDQELGKRESLARLDFQDPHNENQCCKGQKTKLKLGLRLRRGGNIVKSI